MKSTTEETVVLLQAELAQIRQELALTRTELSSYAEDLGRLRTLSLKNPRHTLLRLAVEVADLRREFRILAHKLLTRDWTG